MKQKTLITILVTITLISGTLLGYLVGLSYGSRKSPDQSSKQTITVEGEVICLLPKNPDGPHTTECATGLKATDNTYYSLSIEKLPNSDSLINAHGQVVKVTGAYKAQDSDRYQSKGIITVTSFQLSS